MCNIFLLHSDNSVKRLVAEVGTAVFMNTLLNQNIVEVVFFKQKQHQTRKFT